MKKKNSKFNLLLDGFLRSTLAQSMNPQELEDLLKSVESKNDEDMMEISVVKASQLARHCEKSIRMFKIVLEDMISVLISAYRNGCLDDMIKASKSESSTKMLGCVQSQDGSTEEIKFDDLSESQKELFKRRKEHADKLFTKEGMTQFLEFVENEVGTSYMKMWDDIDFLNQMLEASVCFQKATPEEMQEMLKKMSPSDEGFGVSTADKEALN